MADNIIENIEDIDTTLNPVTKDHGLEMLGNVSDQPVVLRRFSRTIFKIGGLIKGLATGKEDKFNKKSGFNLEKSDSVTTKSSVILATLTGIKTVWDALTSHRNSINNPHVVTKSQVGLGSVNNYTITDSVTDGSSNKYASAKGLKSAYDKGVEGLNKANTKEPIINKKPGFNLEKSDSVTTNSSVILATAKAIKTVWDALTSHRNSTNNPHAVTKSQVGLGNVNNYTITDSVTDGSSGKYGSAKAAKIAYDRGSSGVTKADAAQNSANSAQTKANQAYTLAAGCPYDVGDYWITESTSNPATKWTGTTWTKLEGRVLLGTSSGYALGSQGGRPTVALTLANIAAHTHGFSGTTNTTGNHYHQGGDHRHRVDNHAHTQPAHTHSYSSYYGGNGLGGSMDRSQVAKQTGSAGGENTGGASPYTNYQNPNTSTTGNHNHTISGTTGSSGSGSAFNIMNPYRVVNIWRRTA